MKYNVIINGKKQGTIETIDIEGFVQKNYQGVGFEISGNNLLLNLTIGQAMSIGTKNHER